MLKADCKGAEELLRSVLVGNCLAAVGLIAPDTWAFQFSGAHLNVSVPWRILDSESIRLGSCDHEQKFGLSQPIDAVAVTMELLAAKRVENLMLDRKSADLRLAFAGNFFWTYSIIPQAGKDGIWPPTRESRSSRWEAATLRFGAINSAFILI